MPSVHRDFFVSMVKQYGWTRGAELGVDKAILFGMMLKLCPNLELLIGVDTFPDPQRSHRAFDLALAYWRTATLKHMTTREASGDVEDGSLDFVFIDADHSYKAVADDIACWRSKVRSGGWLGGHDYSKKFPGVIKAVDQAFGKSVRVYPGTIWGVWV